MKKYLSLLTLVLLFTGCLSNQSVNHNNNLSKKYHEIETSITNENIEYINRSDGIIEERERLEKEGKELWYDQNDETDILTSMRYLDNFIKCSDGKKEDCIITSLIEPDQDNLPDGFKVNKCDRHDDCFEITPPTFLKDLISNLNQIDSFYYLNKDFYTIGRFKDDDIYSIFKNSEEIFSHKMTSCDEAGADVVEKMTIVMNSPAITFCDWDETKNSPSIDRNLWYQGKILNDEHDLDSASNLFSFKEKIGFVGEKDGQKFLFFDGQKVSQNFDEIRTHVCCSGQPFPIKIDIKGVLFFLATRGDKYFFVEVDLNDYLN